MSYKEILAEAKTRFSDDDIRIKVLEDAYDSALNDGDYL